MISESKTQICLAGEGEFLGRMGSNRPSTFFSTLTSPFSTKKIQLWCTKTAKWIKRQDKIVDDVVSEKNGYLNPLLKAFLTIVTRNYFKIFEHL